MKPRTLLASLLSIGFFFLLLGVWHLATLPKAKEAAADTEYSKLMGKSSGKPEGFPTPAQMGEAVQRQLSDAGRTTRASVSSSRIRSAASLPATCWR